MIALCQSLSKSAKTRPTKTFASPLLTVSTSGSSGIRIWYNAPMPLVKIEMYPGRTKETKKKLIEQITKDVAETAACPPEAVTVVIEDIPKENWGFGGKQVA